MKKNNTKQTTAALRDATLQQTILRTAKPKRQPAHEWLDRVQMSGCPSGPGESAHLSSCTADIYLSSDLDPTCILGRPTVSALVDQWGGFIYGLSIGVGISQEDDARLVLTNALIDKAQWCAEYGLAIAKEEWPVTFLPSKVIVDRGALPESAMRSLTEARIAIYNAPPQGAVLKGIVEKHFSLINNQIVNWLPYPASKFRSDVRSVPMDATLTLRDFCRMVIGAVLKYHQHLLPHYRLTRELIVERVKPCPLDYFAGVCSTERQCYKDSLSPHLQKLYRPVA